MTRQISEEEMAVYRETARRRQAMKQQALAERRQRAWDLARQAAALLKEELGARIRRKLADVAVAVARARQLMEKAQRTGDDEGFADFLEQLIPGDG